MTNGAQNVDLRSILTTKLRWGILLAIQCFFPILCTYHSSRDNGGFPKQCLVFPKFWVFGPWGAQFWLNSKMILVFLVDLVTPNQMPFTVCFYVASFSRSLGGGGGYPPPPPPPVLSWLRPPPVRESSEPSHVLFAFMLTWQRACATLDPQEVASQDGSHRSKLGAWPWHHILLTVPEIRMGPLCLLCAYAACFHRSV